MARKGVFPIVATLAVVGVVLAVFSQTVMRDSNISTNTMTTEQAYADLSGKMKRIGVQEVSVNPQQLDVSEFLDAKDELPDIDSSYPFVVEGNGDVNIEIFSSGEKAAESGSDSFLTSMAKKFNAQHNKTSGDKTMSVSLRSVPSGTAAEYISTGKYQPECYTPSNTLFGELVKNEGVELTIEADRLAGNVAGILVSKKTGDMLRSEYGEASVSSVLNATIDGKLMMGYSNPYTSATGLNFLLAALASSGSDTIVDTAAVENFQRFQANVPLVSFTTQQMVQSADKGIVDGVVMEYQSYQNDPTLQRNYEFIPFGVRHDNPLYSIGNVSAEKKEVIAAFVSFCAQNQAEATKDGFNGLDDYVYTGKVYDGNTIAQAQSVWKEEKDSGIPIVAEFVVDTSGSMRGEPLNALKTAMINTIQYINDDNYIGIIGFDSDVREYLPIDQFSLTQKTLYKGAVNSLDANGSTAMYNGLCVRGTVAEECPRVAAMWHPTANSVSPQEVTCGSNRKIALICPKCGYGKNGEWRPSIAGACRTGGGCPACSGKVLVEGVNDVATVHPEIAAQWHPTLNEFPPTRVTSGSAKHVYLVCKDCGYGANGEWHPMIAFACGSGGVHTGCPECARNSLRKAMRAHYAKTARKPVVSVACPQIAALWHPENEFGPDMYTTGSCKNIPLVCTACGYGKDKDWTPSIADVCRKGAKCPFCGNIVR